MLNKRGYECENCGEYVGMTKSGSLYKGYCEWCHLEVEKTEKELDEYDEKFK